MGVRRISKDEYYLGIAKAVAKRSTCLKRRYGCVIVKNDEIISTGYNGSPRGEENCCDVYDECPRLNVAHNSGDYSNCPSVHAEQNAMLSASRKDMLGATMYLSCEEEKTFCCDSETECDNCKKDCCYANKRFIEVADCSPCPICLRMIKNAGIKRVITKGGEIFL